MITINKILAAAQVGTIIALVCTACALTSVHASVTVSFGKQPPLDPSVRVLASALQNMRVMKP